jgi:flagellar hook assembly protein FlgD
LAPEPGVSVTFVAPAHPNPTSTSAIFRYSIGSDVAGQGEVGVSLAIYDSRGRLVRTLVNGRQSVGEFRAMWDGRGERGGRVSAGVYYYRFRAGAHSENSSLVITR